MSRPPEHPDGARERVIRCRVTESERQEILRRARERGMSISDYLRMRALTLRRPR